MARILKSSTRNALLVGVGGSGRQSVTKLAAFMADFETFGIELTSTYGVPRQPASESGAQRATKDKIIREHF